MSVPCPIVTITLTGKECYRGYIIYSPPSIPENSPWFNDPVYNVWPVVYFNNPVPNVTGDTPYWIGRKTVTELKLAIDNVILIETPYKQNPEGDQC